jgi:triacylglycerol lipase
MSGPERTAAPTVGGAPIPTITDLQIHDTLAAGTRLWLRGRLTFAASMPTAPRRWWQRWRRPGPRIPLTVQLRTEVAGLTLETGTAVQPDGMFEAAFEVNLPPTRRGWRIARNHVILGDQTLLACSVVMEPPAEARTATVVILPFEFTLEAGGVQRLTQWLLAGPMAELFRRRQHCQTTPCPVYYLAAVPERLKPDAQARGSSLQPELALAITAMGWPSGPFLLAPTPRAEAPEALADLLDRLRWLLAGRLDLLVINQEPRAESVVQGVVRPKPDRAAVDRFVRFDEDLSRISTLSAVPAARLLPARQRPAHDRCVPRHPLVFCHGMLAMTMLRMQMPADTNYFIHLRPFLAERGIDALFPNVAPTGGVLERAEQLRDQVQRWTDEPVNLIAHSMGGLDARCLISRLGLAHRVRSLTTIATPHRGSTLAEWFHVNFRQRLPLFMTLEALGLNIAGFRDCRPGPCHEFNNRTPDAPEVRYFSYSAAVTPPRISPLLRRGWGIITPQEGPNDGIVSVRSARWGEELGTIAVDHFAQTPDGLFIRPNENFDTLGFYSRLIEALARRGL